MNYNQDERMQAFNELREVVEAGDMTAAAAIEAYKKKFNDSFAFLVNIGITEAFKKAQKKSENSKNPPVVDATNSIIELANFLNGKYS